MSQKQQLDSISTGLKRGWLFGCIMLGIYLLYIIVNQVSSFPTRFLAVQNAPSAVIQYGIPGVLMLISFIVFRIGGILASAETGQVSAGWIAGNFGGLVYGIGSFLVFGVYLFAFWFPYLGISPDNQTLYWSEVTGSLSNQLVTIALFGGIFMGNLGGSIGGLIGRGRVRRTLLSEN
jgi:hypothetical protein